MSAPRDMATRSIASFVAACSLPDTAGAGARADGRASMRCSAMSVLQCVAVCCSTMSVLQCVTVCCSATSWRGTRASS